MSEKRQRGAIVSVRFTADELAQVEKRAHAAGMTISGFMREQALAVAYPPAERKTYYCQHFSIDAPFNEPPTCSQGCAMSERPVTSNSRWGVKTIWMWAA
jgi:hypothetical protein